MIGSNPIDISNKSTKLERPQHPPYPPAKYKAKLPTNSGQTAESNSVIPSVTPDRPPKNTDNSNSKNSNSNNSSNNQLLKKEEGTAFSSPPRPGSTLIQSAENNYQDANHNNEKEGSPFNTFYPKNQRYFPTTPQYDQIYTADPHTPNNKKSPYLPQHFFQKSPFKRVRLADDVVVTPKRYRGDFPKQSYSSFSRVSVYPMAHKSDPSFLRPRPGPYSQFGPSFSSVNDQMNDDSAPTSSEQQRPQSQQQQQQQPQKQQQDQQQQQQTNQHMPYVIETGDEVELILKPNPNNSTSNQVASSPERSSSGRGPYTQMTRGAELTETRDTVADNKQPSTNLGGKKVKSPTREVGTTGGGKISIVSPEDDNRGGGPYNGSNSGGGSGHNRNSSFSNMWEFHGTAPESPYNSYSTKAPKSAYNSYNQSPAPPQSPYKNSSGSKPGNFFKYPPSSPVKSNSSNSPSRNSNAGHQQSPPYGYQSTNGASGTAPSAPSTASPQCNNYAQNYARGSGVTTEGGYYPEEPPYGDGAPSRGSPGKRQRVTESDDKKPIPNPPTPYRYPNQRPYASGPNPNSRPAQNHPHYPGHPSASSESFEIDNSGPAGGRMAAPRVLKATSYPPPPSSHTDTANVSSAASYPGNVGPGRPLPSHPHPPPHPPHPHEGRREYGYGGMPPVRSVRPPYRPEYYYPNDSAFPPNGGRVDDYHPPERPYYTDTHAGPPPQQPPPPGGGGPECYDPSNGEYYYPHGPPPQPQQSLQPEETSEVHPLLINYDPDRDRRVPGPNVSQSSPASSSPNSPERSSPKTPSKKGKDLEVGSSGSTSASSTSPNRRKPSTAAHAAIAAGMTQPPSAQEVDFDIHNPPLKPITLPSDDPACPVPSNVNSHDVLCGRGGGTNTQIGNRRFRLLVQEFQPIYLLCRRKEKPLIARTIVLIIRHRGGRFLKKDEVSGMLFEVGDEKAEAKTSQALREGLDVRASKGSSSESKRKSRKKKPLSTLNQKVKGEQSHQSYGEDVTMVDSTPPREGPPPHNDGHHAYPGYYYGYEEGYYNAAGGGYEHHPHHPPPYTPSRKRQRPPPPVVSTPGMYHYPTAPPFKGYGYPPSHTPHAPPSSQEYYPPPHRQVGMGGGPLGASMGGDEDHSVWEMDFSPPRGFKRDDGGRHGVEDSGQIGYTPQENQI